MRRIIAALDDIFFAAKIRTTAEHLNLEITFTRDADATFVAAAQSLRDNSSTLLVLDLHAQRFDPFAIINRLKSDAQTSPIPIVAFFSHVNTDLMHRAQESGVDRVMPRSAFTKNLASILHGETQ